MKNQVIEVLDEEHGWEVIQYWKDRGVNTFFFNGSCCKENGLSRRYYGVINDCFYNYTIHEVRGLGAEIITLPDPEWKPKRGDKVLVWENEGDEREAIFIAEIEGAKYPVITVAYGYEEDFKDGKTFDIAGWSYMKPYKKEVTMQEIAEKFGVDVEQLKIKK